MKVCKLLPNCSNCGIGPMELDIGCPASQSACNYCERDLREYEFLGIQTVGIFRKPVGFLVNRDTGNIFQTSIDLIYDIKNVPDNYFSEKNKVESEE